MPTITSLPIRSNYVSIPKFNKFFIDLFVSLSAITEERNLELIEQDQGESAGKRIQ